MVYGATRCIKKNFLKHNAFKNNNKDPFIYYA